MISARRMCKRTYLWAHCPQRWKPQEQLAEACRLVGILRSAVLLERTLGLFLQRLDMRDIGQSTRIYQETNRIEMKTSSWVRSKAEPLQGKVPPKRPAFRRSSTEKIGKVLNGIFCAVNYNGWGRSTEIKLKKLVESSFFFVKSNYTLWLCE